MRKNNKTFSIILSAAIAVVSILQLPDNRIYAASPSANAGKAEFAQNFDYQSTVTNPNSALSNSEKWISINGATVNIENGVAVMSGISSTNPAIYSRPVSEAVIDQEITVDVLNVGNSEHRAYARLTQAAASPTVLNAYYAAVSAERFSIGALTNNNTFTELYGIELKANQNHTYRLRFTAKGTNPTVLTAKLYDLTEEKFVTKITAEDSATALQVNGMGGIGAYSPNADSTAIFDNFSFKQISTDVQSYADFSTCSDGNVEKDWVLADEQIQIADGKLSIYDSLATENSAAVSSSYPLAMRPYNEKALNQKVRIRLDSLIAGGAFTNTHPVILLRVNGNDSNVKDRNGRTLKQCYGALLENKGYNSATRLKIFRITSTGWTELVSFKVSGSQKPFITVTRNTRNLYFNFSATQTDSKTTKLEASISLVKTDTVNDMSVIPLASVSIDDTSNELQSPGTVGLTYKLMDDWQSAGRGELVGNASYRFNVSEFIYLSDDKTAYDVDLDGAVNSRDLVALRKLLLGIETIDDSNGDVNNDKEINILDLIKLKKKLSGSAVLDITEENITNQSFSNVLYKLETEKKLKIAYFGDSVTAGTKASDPETTSWAALTTAGLKELYPDAQITDINASIGGSGALLGSMRTYEQVLSFSPDIVFVSYGINDNSFQYTTGEAERYMESIIRQIRAKNPFCAIIITYSTGISGKGTLNAPQLEFNNVAEHYGIKTLNLTALLNAEIGGSSSLWWDFKDPECYFADGAHPTDKGYAKYAEYALKFLTDNLSSAKSNLSEYAVIPMPRQLKQNLFSETSIIRPEKIAAENPNVGTLVTTDINSEHLTYFNSININANQTVTIEFTGNSVGMVLWEKTGTTAGTLKNCTVLLDDDSTTALDIMNTGAIRLERMLYDNLANGNHSLTITTGESGLKIYCIFSAKYN